MAPDDMLSTEIPKNQRVDGACDMLEVIDASCDASAEATDV